MKILENELNKLKQIKDIKYYEVFNKVLIIQNLRKECRETNNCRNNRAVIVDK